MIRSAVVDDGSGTTPPSPPGSTDQPAGDGLCPAETRTTQPTAPSALLTETHCAWVLVTGEVAIKWKKPLQLGFVDWRTVAARRQACEREIGLNRRFAPDVYRDLLTITDSAGRVRECLVLMNRMPAARRMSTLVTGGRLVDDPLRATARILAAHHAGARRTARIESNGTPAALLSRWMSNLAVLAETSELVGHDRLTTITTLARDYIAGRHPLLAQRMATGRVRDGHGDLLADDIFCLDDGPRILDCLEFDDDLRSVDAIDDAAVLAMDLERLGAPDLALEFMNRFVEFSADPCPSSLVHHYIAYRAVMRAKIAAIRFSQGDPDAATQVRLLTAIGLRHLQRAQPTLIVIGGLPGTGKTTIASHLADTLGAVLLRSDRLRKEHAGLDPNGSQRGDAALYTDERTRSTYGLMAERAGLLLGRGESVIVDATWSDAGARADIRAVATGGSAALRELRCVTPRALADRRLRDRQTAGDDPSDATPEVAHALAATFDPWPGATIIDTAGPLPRSRRDALAAVGAVGAE